MTGSEVENVRSRRILFLVSDMGGGGAERVAANLCNHWAGIGHDVTLMHTFSGPNRSLHRLDSRVTVDYLNARLQDDSKSVLSKFRRLMALRKAVVELNPDVVISFLTNVNIAAILASFGTGHRVIISERVFPPEIDLGFFWRLLRRLLYRWSDLIVVQTNDVADWLLKHCGGVRTVVIPNPLVYPIDVSEPTLCPDNWVEPEKKLILAVGRLHEQKGFDKFLAAFSELAAEYSDWDAVVIGEGPRLSELEAYRDEKGLKNRIHFPGWVGNISDWYQRADIYILSSRFEGFPNTLLEAMAYELPVISFDCCTGPGQIIRNKQEGWLVSPSEGVNGLENAMRSLMSDSALRASMGSMAAQVKTRFSMEAIADLWDEVL